MSGGRSLTVGGGKRGTGVLGLLALMLFSFTSCASLVRYEAQSEFDLGMGAFNQGRYDEAALRFQKTTEIDPNFAPAYLYLGRSYLSLRNYSRALPPLRTAYRLAPEDFKRNAPDMLLDALFGTLLGEDTLDSNGKEVLRLLREFSGK
jgi:tetratricopeptide (TPR) repeat protein